MRQKVRLEGTGMKHDDHTHTHTLSRFARFLSFLLVDMRCCVEQTWGASGLHSLTAFTLRLDLPQLET